MGLFDGDATCRLCRKETETVQHIICCCEVLAPQRYKVFGNPLVEPTGISTASVRDLIKSFKRSIKYNTYYLHIFDSVFRAIKFVSYFDLKIHIQNCRIRN